jgi:predicted Zn-dependent protease
MDVRTSSLGVNDKLSMGGKNLPSNIKVNSDCVGDAAYEGSTFISETEKMMIEMSGVTISDNEVNEFGDNAYKEIVNEGEFRFVESGEMYDDLQRLLKELLVNADLNSGINYKIHLIDDELVNAFTVGGHIFITTGIIDFANSRSAVAFVVGHEIGHNENGDLELLMKKLKIANSLVEGSGNIGVALQQILTPFYNQVNEIESDRFGANICYQSGYDPRKGVEMWRRMSEKEGSKNIVEGFARSHPYSIDRMNCLEKYINSNFDL